MVCGLELASLSATARFSTPSNAQSRYARNFTSMGSAPGPPGRPGPRFEVTREMGKTKGTLTRTDLELLHEALTYMRKRVFEQAEVVRVRGMIERIEDCLLGASERAPFRLSPPEIETLERQVRSYCDATTQRGASAEARDRAKQLERLVARIAGRSEGRGSWWRRLIGR